MATLTLTPKGTELLGRIGDYAAAHHAVTQTRTPHSRRAAEAKAAAILEDITARVVGLEAPAQDPREYPDIGQHILAMVKDKVAATPAGTEIRPGLLATELGLKSPVGVRHVDACLSYLCQSTPPLLGSKRLAAGIVYVRTAGEG